MIGALTTCALMACTPAPPLDLPAGDARARAAQTTTWIVGARPGPRADAVARAHGVRREIGDGTYVVARARARALARAMGRDLVWAEPNRTRTLRQAPPPPSDPVATPWRAQVVADGLQPPAVTTQSPLLALIDSPLDPTHPEFAGSNTTAQGGRPLSDLHGTATAAVAAAPQNGTGMIGLWPGMRAVNVPLPPQPFGCADSANGIRAAVQAGAKVINMSYGSADFCFAEYVQLQSATARQVSLVAAAGNEFDEGNPLEFPASMPHVITVAAVGPDLKSSFFSNANAAIDLSAPGEQIVTAVPLQYDEDATKDGYMPVSGTSFAAPIVSAATTWVRAARPDLSVDQVAQVVRLSARDLGRRGWDPDTGFGLLDVDAALKREAPLRDPLEPNDDLVWVNGQAFGRADRAIWKPSPPTRRVTLRAVLDRFEDPADVYRVIVPRRRTLKITVDPRFGDPELGLFSRGARSLSDRRNMIAFTDRRGGGTETVFARNRSGSARTYYVAVGIDQRARSLDAVYTLRARLLRR